MSPAQAQSESEESWFEHRRAIAERPSEAARIRAEARRKHWTGEQSMLSQPAPPPPLSDAAERLTVVARVSQLVAGLQHVHRAAAAMRATKSAR